MLPRNLADESHSRPSYFSRNRAGNVVGQSACYLIKSLSQTEVIGLVTTTLNHAVWLKAEFPIVPRGYDMFRIEQIRMLFLQWNHLVDESVAFALR